MSLLNPPQIVLMFQEPSINQSNLMMMYAFHSQGANVADGSLRFLNENTPNKVINALLLAKGKTVWRPASCNSPGFIR